MNKFHALTFLFTVLINSFPIHGMWISPRFRQKQIALFRQRKAIGQKEAELSIPKIYGTSVLDISEFRANKKYTIQEYLKAYLVKKIESSWFASLFNRKPEFSFNEIPEFSFNEIYEAFNRFYAHNSPENVLNFFSKQSGPVSVLTKKKGRISIDRDKYCLEALFLMQDVARAFIAYKDQELLSVSDKEKEFISNLTKWVEKISQECEAAKKKIIEDARDVAEMYGDMSSVIHSSYMKIDGENVSTQLFLGLPYTPFVSMLSNDNYLQNLESADIWFDDKQEMIFLGKLQEKAELLFNKIVDKCHMYTEQYEKLKNDVNNNVNDVDSEKIAAIVKDLNGIKTEVLGYRNLLEKYRNAFIVVLDKIVSLTGNKKSLEDKLNKICFNVVSTQECIDKLSKQYKNLLAQSLVNILPWQEDSEDEDFE